jgi:D-serine deaminase-like pyridoxal phosphate-dependent protein
MRRFPEFLRALPIDRPTLLLDQDRTVRNLSRMKKKVDAAGVGFRPHFKTHQSAEIGEWFRPFGVESITVSSLDMAKYFARHGWEDISVAFSANLREVEAINYLAQKIRLHLLVDSVTLVAHLDSALRAGVQAWIDVDVGYPRTGIPWDDFPRILSTARAIQKSSKISFSGLLTHSGHTYNAQSVEEIKTIHGDSLSRLLIVQDKLGQEGIHPCAVSIGDTPSCSVADSFTGADEIRPGNFVFYDLMMCRLGICREEDIAVAVACPVVAIDRDAKRVVIYGGAVHFSKESIPDDRGTRIYGYASSPGDHSWGPADRGAPVLSLSQEHGLIEMGSPRIEETKVGDLLTILPVHSCLTSDLYRSYLTLDGKKINRRQSNDRT